MADQNKIDNLIQRLLLSLAAPTLGLALRELVFPLGPADETADIADEDCEADKGHLASPSLFIVAELRSWSSS